MRSMHSFMMTCFAGLAGFAGVALLLALFAGPAPAGSDAAETASEAWDKTKDAAATGWEATKQGSQEAWDATKEGSGKAWDATKETSSDAWEATKSGAQATSDTAVEIGKGVAEDTTGLYKDLKKAVTD